jgi:hypothetical protein
MDIFKLAGFVFHDNLSALAKCLCISLLFAQGFLVTLFLFKRVDAAFNLFAQLTGLIAGFGKRYFGVTAQPDVAAVNNGFTFAVRSCSDGNPQNPHAGIADDKHVETIYAADSVAAFGFEF